MFIHVQEFVQAIFAPVAQGYGATETAACSTVQECFGADGRPADLGGGRVGAIQPANEIKLLSVPDMGYLVTDSPPRCVFCSTSRRNRKETEAEEKEGPGPIKVVVLESCRRESGVHEGEKVARTRE